MADEPYTWDESIPMLGTIEVHWSVTLDEDGDVIVWVSPWTDIPDELPGEEGQSRRGTHLALGKPLTYHTDEHLAVAGNFMAKLAIREWIEPYITTRIVMGMREQRDRLGGYIEGTTPLVNDDTEPEEG